MIGGRSRIAFETKVTAMSDRNTHEENDLDKNLRDLTYTLTYKEVVDILEIIDRSTCHELRVESGDLKLTVIKRGYPE